MFGIFKRLKAMEAENKSLTGILARELREKYKGKFASFALFSGYHKINDVRIEGGLVQIKIHNEICIWLDLRECDIADKDLHARSINIFENIDNMLEKLKFDIKLSDSSVMKGINTKLSELQKEVDSLKPRSCAKQKLKVKPVIEPAKPKSKRK
jgi:hypothetical protein